MTASARATTVQRARRAVAGVGQLASGAPLRRYDGNHVELLINGEQFFPRLLQAIAQARRSIHLETYIFSDDSIGQRVAQALAEAAHRGVTVRLIIDGFGGGAYARALATELEPQGVEVLIYRPERWWRFERKLLRRLHRKIGLFDDALAFVGGINIIDDHNVPLGERGKVGPRFDFAVSCEGPLIEAIARTTRGLWAQLRFGRLRGPRMQRQRSEPLPHPRPIEGGVSAALAVRDNFRHRRSIERAYNEAIGAARREVLIANAYFLPGRSFRALLAKVRARGVRVRLLLQGRIEYRLHHHAQRALYGQLLAAGIEIFEYMPSYLHAKVAVVDNAWSTVGSSNIDPYSLLLAREANVMIYGESFARRLHGVLDQVLRDDAVRVDTERYAQRGRLARAIDWMAYGIVRLAATVLARGRDY